MVHIPYNPKLSLSNNFFTNNLTPTNCSYYLQAIMNVANPDEHEVGAMVLSRKRQQPDEATTDFGIPATIARLAGPLNEPTAESPPCVNIPETSLRLEDVKPTFEPLKVCLDDDSSLDDGEENIFDDKDFYFGDEDIQSLMARDTKGRKILTSNTSHIQPFRILSPPASLSCATLTLNASVPSREVDTMFTAAKSNSQAPAETANAIKQPTSEAILLSSASSCPSGEHKGVLALFLVYQNELRRTRKTMRKYCSTCFVLVATVTMSLIQISIIYSYVEIFVITSSVVTLERVLLLSQSDVFCQILTRHRHVEECFLNACHLF